MANECTYRLVISNYRRPWTPVTPEVPQGHCRSLREGKGERERSWGTGLRYPPSFGETGESRFGHRSMLFALQLNLIHRELIINCLLKKPISELWYSLKYFIICDKSCFLCIFFYMTSLKKLSNFSLPAYSKWSINNKPEILPIFTFQYFLVQIHYRMEVFLCLASNNDVTSRTVILASCAIIFPLRNFAWVYILGLRGMPTLVFFWPSLRPVSNYCKNVSQSFASIFLVPYFLGMCISHFPRTKNQPYWTADWSCS